MKRLLAFLPVLVFVGVLVGFMAGLRMDPSIMPSMLIGKPLPKFDLAPVTADNPKLASTDLVGEPALLNVFASWCVACQVEHPTLMRLRAQGVVIHGLDWKDDPVDGARWLAEKGDPYLRIGSDPSGRAGIDMGVSGVPETFVVDKRGRVRYRQVGAITPEVWATVLEPLMAKLRTES
jgi:cytochrome c biogenesis protein CcmG/thiol:disulfide interchange protein DsbE